MYLCIICSLEVRSAVVTELLTYTYCHLLKYRTIAFIAKTTVGQTEFVFIKLESQKGRYITLGNVYRSPKSTPPSWNRHRSNGDCLESKRENYQVCSVQYCTVNCTHIWTDLTVLWIRFCLTRLISLCLDSLWPPYVILGPLYFCPVVSFLLSSFFYSSPNLSGRRLDLTHGVALVRI